MFSRTIFTDKKSEKIATHQRLIRAARRQLREILPQNMHLPTSKSIIHFEGANGPDGLAGKGNTADEPCQFINPKEDDGKLIGHIKHHLHNTHQAYKHKNMVRLEFEMAWMSHMIIDGLTPAHQQPFKEQIKELDDRGIEEINSYLKRILTPGDGVKDTFAKNWKRLGPKGVGTNHIMFEAGIDFIVMPLTPKQLAANISKEEIKKAKDGHFIEMYWQSVQKIAELQMFERYETSGWSTLLAQDIRVVLLPEAVKCVVLGWIAGIYSGK